MIALFIIAYLVVSAGFAAEFVQSEAKSLDTRLELCMGFLMMFAAIVFSLPFLVGVLLFRAFDK